MLFKGEKSLFPRMRYDYVIEEKKKILVKWESILF